MKISTRQSDDVLIVDMEGRLDSRTAVDSNDEMERILKAGSKHIIVNLEKLDFLTSAGIRVLLLTAKLQQSTGGQLRLCSANELVTETLETAGFSRLLRLYPTEAEAIKSF
uniref:Anti-sigma factor antagonist n=1 Tax=Cyanothece sp. (strain PCC 7425 / ATCC 29141) TaxID=395961 RepID=B8HV42_CYAP4